MPFYDLPSIFEKYDIFISNYETELNLSDDEPSSASYFPCTTDLDISPLLFLRAPVAKIGIQYVTIENLCLCFLDKELIKINFSSPPNINSANFFCTSDVITEKNATSFNIQFSDYSATSIDDCLSYINNLIEGNLSSFLIYRLSLNFFDLDLFKDLFSKPASIDNKISLSLKDIEILLRYIDCCLFTRRLLNAVLNGHDTTTLSSSVFTPNLLCLKPKLTALLEKNILNKSKILKNEEERLEYSYTYVFTTTDFKDFYSVDLKKESSERSDLAAKITSDFNNKLEDFFNIDSNDLPSADEKLLSDLKESNIKLIKQGLTLQKILLIQREKYESNFSPSLFATEPISIQKDESGSKTSFEIFNKQFLPPDDSQLQLSIDQQASYSLGCLPSSSITIGPLTFASECQKSTITSPKLTSNILSSYQKLHGPCRFHPKVLNILCDVLSTSDQRIVRPINEDFPNFKSLFSILVDENHFNTRFFCKNSDEITYHRMLKTETLLQRFYILICDENERQVHFPRNSLFYAKLVIAPNKNEIDH